MEMNGHNKGMRTWQVCLLMLVSASLAASITILALFMGVGGYRIAPNTGEYDAELISRLTRAIDEYYYFEDDAPDARELIENAAHELVSSVGDPYAAYYTEAEYAAFRSELNGNYKGIGVLVRATEANGLLVDRAYDDNPAYDAGVRDGDYIVEVDGHSIIGLDVDAASGLLMGEDGSNAVLTVIRDGTRLQFTAKRGDVYVKRVYFEVLESNIGYVRIESFTGNAAEEFDAALDVLLERGIVSLVLDIRDDPGGSLNVVVDICDRLLPECTITTIKGKLVDPPEAYYSTDEEKLEIPYVVLTNGYSASASEIFASAVQDNKQGTLIGTTTYGKGIVQTSWELGNGLGYIKLTTDAYFTPNGTLIHGIGVTPDIIVEQDAELENYEPYYIMRDFRDRDLQLKAAIEFLKNK